MRTLTATAEYPTLADALLAAGRMLDWRHDPGNAVIGGAAHVTGDGPATVVASFRVHPDTTAEQLDALTAELRDDLTDADGAADVAAGELDMVPEQYVDDAGQVQTRDANRVILTETGETVTRGVRMVRAVDDDGTELGRLPIVTLTGEDGRKLTFAGEQGERAGLRGATDTAETRDEVTVQHTPASKAR